MKKWCAIVLMAVCSSHAPGQSQGEWEQPFDFGPNGGPFTRAINLVHVWSGGAPKVLALSGDNPDSRLWTPPPVGSDTVPTFRLCAFGACSSCALVRDVG